MPQREHVFGLEHRIAGHGTLELAGVVVTPSDRPSGSLVGLAADGVLDGGGGTPVLSGQLIQRDAPFRKACSHIQYLGRGEGLLVHTAECSVGRRLFERDSERWIQVAWADELTRSFECSVLVLVNNGKGVLAQLASAISSAEADITHLDMGAEPAHDTAELRLLISVRDRQHLADVLRTLRRVSTVLKVARVKP